MQKTLVILSMLVIAALASCEKPETEGEYQIFIIKKGGHKSHSEVSTTNKASFNFDVKFDSTAIYTTTDSVNQGDINKLYGFSDCESRDHHQNSARFGWNWLDNKLNLYAYCYANAKRSYEYIASIKIGRVTNCRITINADTSYTFYVNDTASVSMKRGCASADTVQKYRLYPYFGGDETAPHDIKILINEF